MTERTQDRQTRRDVVADLLTTGILRTLAGRVLEPSPEVVGVPEDRRPMGATQAQRPAQRPNHAEA